MSNKIYLGEIEVANVGGGGGGEGYVTDSSFNEMTKVAASALLDLKGLEDDIEAFDEKIEGHVEAIDTQIQNLESTKADASSVYDKDERDKTDKVAAAALASLDGRVTILEQGGGGGGITPAQLDASLKAYTYDKAYLDASFSAIDINPISEKLTDVSTRVDALEDANFIDSAQLDASLKEYAYNKNYIDASVNAMDVSIQALDASALAFDASIKELAEGGGGGDSVFIKKGNSIVSDFSEKYVNSVGNYNLILTTKSSDSSNNFKGIHNTILSTVSKIDSDKASNNLLNGTSISINNSVYSQYNLLNGYNIALYGNTFVSNIINGWQINLQENLYSYSSIISLYGNNIINLYGKLYGSEIFGYYWSKSPIP